MLCKRPALFKMTFIPRSDGEAADAITRLVDGTLSDAEQHDVEAWANSSSELQRTVSQHRHVRRALATEGPPTPSRLIDAVGARTATRPRSGLRWRPSVAFGRWPAVAFGSLATVAASIVVVLVLVLGGSGSQPSIGAAARLALHPASGSAPSVASAHYLDVSYHGVTFPNYEHSLNAVATGQTRNTIGGRSALTVFYRLHGGQPLSYTVFSGRPIDLPGSARLTHFHGVPLHVYRTDGLSVVTLVRHGRTCVLAAPTTDETVLALAAEPVRAASSAA